jgi:hypothetical protein
MIRASGACAHALTERMRYIRTTRMKHIINVMTLLFLALAVGGHQSVSESGEVLNCCYFVRGLDTLPWSMCFNSSCTVADFTLSLCRPIVTAP